MRAFSGGATPHRALVRARVRAVGWRAPTARPGRCTALLYVTGLHVKTAPSQQHDHPCAAQMYGDTTHRTAHACPTQSALHARAHMAARRAAVMCCLLVAACLARAGANTRAGPWAMRAALSGKGRHLLAQQGALLPVEEGARSCPLACGALAALCAPRGAASKGSMTRVVDERPCQNRGVTGSNGSGHTGRALPASPARLAARSNSRRSRPCMQELPRWLCRLQEGLAPIRCSQRTSPSGGWLSTWGQPSRTCRPSTQISI